jgi:hypothetical protein
MLWRMLLSRLPGLGGSCYFLDHGIAFWQEFVVKWRVNGAKVGYTGRSRCLGDVKTCLPVERLCSSVMWVQVGRYRVGRRGCLMWHDNSLRQEQDDGSRRGEEEGDDKIEIRCLGKGKG